MFYNSFHKKRCVAISRDTVFKKVNLIGKLPNFGVIIVILSGIRFQILTNCNNKIEIFIYWYLRYILFIRAALETLIQNTINI